MSIEITYGLKRAHKEKKTDSQEEMLANISGIFVIQHFPHFLNLLFYNVSRIGETAQKLKENWVNPIQYGDKII